MKKQLVIIGIIALLVSVGLSGCNSTEQTTEQEQNNEKPQNGNTILPDSDGDGYRDDMDAFPNDRAEWKDSDKDGHGDNSDAFPYDRSEWKDSDKDGVGDNSDPYPFDYDNDGVVDSKDLKINGDAAIKITLKKFCVLDELDFLFTTVEVYFEIYIHGRLEARIDNNGNSWYATTGQTYNMNKEIVYNIEDDQRYTDIRILMMDDDFILPHDPIDIDGHNESKALSIVFDAITGTWSGDDNDGYTDGSDDGTQNTDDDDGILWYSISISEMQYNKAYEWMYGFKPYSLRINIPRDRYTYYRYVSTNRWPSTNSERVAFVTSDEPVIIQIANEMKETSSSNNYNYYDTVNFALSFVQSLKYSYDNESVGSNEYWRFPVETLVDELGDCEDTSVLFASLMEAMGYDAVLISLPGHIAVGISGGDDYPGTYYNYDGKRYYYCETTNTGWTMGVIPTDFEDQTATIIQVS